MLKRTIMTADSPKHMGETVVAAGWAAKVRNLGSLMFIDLRDRYGILQLALDEHTDPTVFALAETVRSEYVLAVKGVIRERSSKNPALPTGDVELYVTELELLAKSETPPFELNDRVNVGEELRLKYRYLDLRRDEMQNIIMARHRIVKLTRDYFDKHNFIEIETPILIKPTPEGARDYLVPSRVHRGSFYALPQSPQLYKQISMLSGFDRYLQIARCFRDEDLRADRQPEFTQIDVEMSFVDEEDVYSMAEGLMKVLYSEILGKDLPLPLPRMTYAEAMDTYGCDKPDTRYGLKLVNLSDILKDTAFAPFKGAIENGGSVRGITVPDGATAYSRKELDKLTDVAKLYKAKGLAYTRHTADGVTSSFEKQLSPEEVTAIRERMGLVDGGLLLIVADSDDNVVFDALSALRQTVAKKMELIPEGLYNALWVTDFPMYEYSPDDGRYYAKHHPFTAPNPEDVPMMDSDAGKVRARAYDMVLNGAEVGGGSIRISDPDLQQHVFTTLGMSVEESQTKFGFLLDAFKYGVPPHGGIAFGLERLVMQLLDKDNIKDVIAFPKTQTASELMTGCPVPVGNDDLSMLAIKVTE